MPRRILEGHVVSDKGDKTITVLVERSIRHPLYKKFVKQTKKYAAHDEANAFQVGDKVQIEECRPISKSKRFRVISDAAAAPAARVEKPAVKKEPAKKPAARKTTAKKPAKKKK